MKPAYIEELKAEPGHISAQSNWPKHVKGEGLKMLLQIVDLFHGRNDCICQAQKPKKMVVDTGGKPSLDELFGRTSDLQEPWSHVQACPSAQRALHHFINR